MSLKHVDGIVNHGSTMPIGAYAGPRVLVEYNNGVSMWWYRRSRMLAMTPAGDDHRIVRYALFPTSVPVAMSQLDGAIVLPRAYTGNVRQLDDLDTSSCYALILAFSPALSRRDAHLVIDPALRGRVIVWTLIAQHVYIIDVTGRIPRGQTHPRIYVRAHRRTRWQRYRWMGGEALIRPVYVLTRVLPHRIDVFWIGPLPATAGSSYAVNDFRKMSRRQRHRVWTAESYVVMDMHGLPPYDCRNLEEYQNVLTPARMWRYIDDRARVQTTTATPRTPPSAYTCMYAHMYAHM